ncbi:type I-B CRISPR-associated protein Cas7/Cst2/DevR [Tardisphaera saccharovorans]
MTKRVFASLALAVTGNVNADSVVGTRVTMKKMVSWDQEIRAFVSPRCVRRSIRKALSEYPTNPPFEISPQQMKGGQLADIGDPVLYIDDDIFGYFSPEKGLGNVQPARPSPIKVSPLIALHHTEIGVEFGGRFPRKDISAKAQEANPAPFEIETAKWLGELQVIAEDRIGKFAEDELTKEFAGKCESEYKQRVSKKGSIYLLPDNERKARAKAFFDVLLRKGWEFPRASEAVSVPEYHYAVAVATNSFIPAGNLLKLDEDLKLEKEKVKQALSNYDWDFAYIIDYESNKLLMLMPGGQEKETDLSKQELNNLVEQLATYIA